MVTRLHHRVVVTNGIRMHFVMTRPHTSYQSSRYSKTV